MSEEGELRSPDRLATASARNPGAKTADWVRSIPTPPAGGPEPDE